MKMEVICFEDEAFFAIIDKVVDRFKETNNITEDKWISGEEAMRKLRITSKTSLQKLRNEGKIRYAQLGNKSILYDKDSIMNYIEDNTCETF